MQLIIVQLLGILYVQQQAQQSHIYDTYSNYQIDNYNFYTSNILMKKGLINHSQNCYMNSLIQAFYTVPTIQYFIRNLPIDTSVFEKYKIRTRSDDQAENFFLPALKQIFTQLDSQTSQSGDPTCVLNSLKLDPGLQEDVVDIYMRLQNCFDDYCYAMDMAGAKFSNTANRDDSTQSIQNCSKYYNQTFNFTIQLKQKCQKCGKQLDLPSENNYSLNILPQKTLFQGINAKFNEIITNNNSCKACNQKLVVLDTKILAPRALIIQLERNQSVYGNMLQKSMKATIIPLYLDMEFLDLYFKYKDDLSEMNGEHLIWVLLQPWLFFESLDGTQIQINTKMIYDNGINQKITDSLLQEPNFVRHVREKYTGRIKNPFISGSQWKQYDQATFTVHWSLTEPELRKESTLPSKLYRTQGFIVHKGIAYAGHYYYMCLDPKAPGQPLELTMYNDQQVHSIGNSSQKYTNMYNIINNFGYGQPVLYFYERVDSQRGAAW